MNLKVYKVKTIKLELQVYVEVNHECCCAPNILYTTHWEINPTSRANVELRFRIISLIHTRKIALFRSTVSMSTVQRNVCKGILNLI